MENENKLNEPEILYSGSKKLTFPNSIEESAELQIRYWAGLTPEQRFSDFYDLMNRFYAFNKPNWSSKKIIVDQ